MKLQSNLISELDELAKKDPFEAYLQAVDHNLPKKQIKKYEKLCTELSEDLKQVEDDYNDGISEGAIFNYDEY